MNVNFVTNYSIEILIKKKEKETIGKELSNEANPIENSR